MMKTVLITGSIALVVGFSGTLLTLFGSPRPRFHRQFIRNSSLCALISQSKELDLNQEGLISYHYDDHYDVIIVGSGVAGAIDRQGQGGS
jgi:hypothetical protein